MISNAGFHHSLYLYINTESILFNEGGCAPCDPSMGGCHPCPTLSWCEDVEDSLFSWVGVALDNMVFVTESEKKNVFLQ